MIKKKYLRSLLPVALVACAFSQPSVAVLDFAANGLPAYEVETLVERLRSELPNTGAVRLVDRKMLENILQEQGHEVVVKHYTIEELLSGVLLDFDAVVVRSATKLTRDVISSSVNEQGRGSLDCRRLCS